MIRLTIPAIPIAQPRQRTRVMSFGGKQIAQNYTPTRHPVNAFKAACQLAAGCHSPLDGPLAVTLEFVLPRPQSQIRKTKPNPRQWHIKKPDFDNLAKSVTDAMTGLLWRDDSQICSIEITKEVAAAEEQPRVVLTVSRLEP